MRRQQISRSGTIIKFFSEKANFIGHTMKFFDQFIKKPENTRSGSGNELIL